MKRRVFIVRTIGENKYRIVLHCGDSVYILEEDKRSERPADRMIVDYIAYKERHPDA